MKFLLDSNAVIGLLKGQEKFSKRLRRHRPAEFGLPCVVAHELYYGAYKSLHVAQNLSRLDALPFQVIEFDREDALLAAKLRASLSAAGTPIGPYDVLIAGQALSRGLTLITRNTREFRRVPDLKTEDWEA
ncbi:MAG TPA: type II toxin-antitoxin system VapC family toxin [Pusillimonas sp.]|uniref:type II toxin-antitoxin system VapC family toxin n=1 Tax=Pusillimonas sp. TaxID=3040095 RepID=UPI002C3431CD|nr:type II toxin-antitoxin system VapC family toxin [Pusillimonas sp.]HUH87182.1 type II toxin-antitoxin system VapC family toxin [Pusillimonas sp.]